MFVSIHMYTYIFIYVYNTWVNQFHKHTPVIIVYISRIILQHSHALPLVRDLVYQYTVYLILIIIYIYTYHYNSSYTSLPLSLQLSKNRAIENGS